jgi:hypothetical protein
MPLVNTINYARNTGQFPDCKIFSEQFEKSRDQLYAAVATIFDRMRHAEARVEELERELAAIPALHLPAKIP